MPDYLAPESNEPSVTSSTEAVDTSSTETATTAETAEDPYDSAADDLVASSEDATETVEPETPKSEEPASEDLPGEKDETSEDAVSIEASEADLQVIRRAKIDPAQISGYSPDQIKFLAETLRTSQSSNDALGAELGRTKKELEEFQELTKEATEADTEREPTDFDYQVDEMVESLIESYDDDIAPIGDLLKSLGSQVSQAREQATAMDPMANLLTELVLDNSFRALEDNYPSLSKPDVRAQADKRFWTEWNSGSYSEQINSGGMLSAMRDAAENAAKVLFSGTEKEAVVNLVEGNKARVASQPKVPSRKPRQAPSTDDDIYNAEWEESGMAKDTTSDLQRAV